MKVIVVDNYQAVSEHAAAIFIDQLKKQPQSVLGLATGSSPIGTYQELIKSYQAKEISFKDVITCNLDEYCGLTKDHPQSYDYFMHQQLFNHVDILEENVNIPSAIGDDLESQCQAYNQLLAQHQIDIQLLGIGANGHIGFNEPNTPFDQETFVVELTLKTREDNQRFFNSLDEVPTHAITMGIANIMRAKKIVMLISGDNKKDAVKRLLTEPVSTDFPASVLHHHPDVVVIIDRSAYSLIGK